MKDQIKVAIFFNTKKKLPIVTARLAAEEVWRGEGEPWLGRTAAERRRAAAEGLEARLTQR